MVMRTFLLGLGFSAYETDRLIRDYGETDAVLQLLSTPYGRKELSQTVEPAAVTAAHVQYCRIWTGTQVFQSMEPFGVPTEIAYRFFLSCGGDDEEGRKHGETEGAALAELMADPYRLVFSFHAPFPAVDDVAKLAGYTSEDVRTEAAIYAALLLAENGGEERDEFVDALAGSTCLPVSRLYKLAKNLLGEGDDTSDDDIADAARRLHFRKKILLTRKELDGRTVMVACRTEMADLEFRAAENIRVRLALGEIDYSTNIWSVIDKVQAASGLYLSYEQAEAVYRAATSRVSVLTGGPGTGKTQTQKVLLETYRRLSGGQRVVMMAPTGQAAKRMESATGYPASTVHSALGIYPGETDSGKADDIRAGLIVVDESSMLDLQLLAMLLDHVPMDANILFIGDVDQLPSIGAGNVLAELIKCVPVSRLTKIFRQSGDAADIAYNAARINAGESRMIESDRFVFVEAEGSAEIQKAVCDIYKQQADAVGLENVVVLTPLRRMTKTGVNQLNRAIRKTCSDEKRYVICKDQRIYAGDKVVFLKNRYGLSNGSIGFVQKVGADKAECQFGERKLTLSGSQLSWIVPAFAETIHKSQGDEHKVVILVADSTHTLSKQLLYTGATRAKENIYIVGERKAFDKACLRNSTHRYSLLSSLVNEEGQA